MISAYFFFKISSLMMKFCTVIILHTYDTDHTWVYFSTSWGRCYNLIPAKCQWTMLRHDSRFPIDCIWSEMSEDVRLAVSAILFKNKLIWCWIFKKLTLILYFSKSWDRCCILMPEICQWTSMRPTNKFWMARTLSDIWGRTVNLLPQQYFIKITQCDVEMWNN